MSCSCDACNIFIAADRKLDQAFTKDIHSQGTFGQTKEVVYEVKGKQSMVEPAGGGGGMAGSRDERVFGKGSSLPTFGDPRLENTWRNGQEPPLSGIDTKLCVRETLPELQRLLDALRR